MEIWLKRLRGAVGTGLTWAGVWAVAGALIGVGSILLPGLPWDLFFDVFDAPLPALGIPGFVGGTIFSVVLGVAGRNRRFDQLSLPWITAWGAAGGVLLGAWPIAIVAESSGTLAVPGLWMLSGLIVGLSALCAGGSLLIAQRAEDQALPAGQSRLLDSS